ncbi:MFS transporter [Burkholderia multivorans]|uniref:Major facilitator family transporter n=1 Tax=Burkholderia multivorans CGD2 TaxID=513052 RepID=B9BQS7_9BURK|nr:MFS transporter [Burkholderia multivorans]MBR8303816.1 MFS transporter [Burkholderia dolosa]EEE06972.1 major facilitator family transporter [Burkholderia multivorans CGD2]EEE13083.1 major facilitator family transporter [Burkholderia multivorans CGD2M]QET31226.1 MFS transporter [Burkholderia multivorans]QET41356.1 MFS transporter [Burkholderia multivorans]
MKREPVVPDADVAPAIAGHTDRRTPERRILATIVIANALEFFDYFSYAVFAAFITRTFFPHVADGYGTLLSLGTFAAGFLSRPIGALAIGVHADAAGRKPALLLTAALVTAGSFGLAVIPGYATLGIAAPIAVLLCRILQGIAIGGEMGASGALLIERCPPDQKCTYAGWLMAGQGLALVAAGACGVALHATLSAAQIERWGWRVPFALAAALIPVQIYLRRHIDETWEARRATLAFGALLGRHRGRWLLAIALIFGGTVPTYVATYATTFGVAGPPPSAYASFVTTAAVGAVTLVLSIAGGCAADRIGRIRTIVLARALTMAVVLPAFYYAAVHPHPLALLGVVALFAGLSALAGAPSIVAILDMFPARGRAAALSVVYATGVALFGGTAPFVVASVGVWAGTHRAAGWYVFVSAAVTLIAIAAARAAGEPTSTARR